MSFHNPYNFVPALPRTGDLPSGLANGPPAGHHRWHPDLWSGRIGVTLTTVSPLLIVENQQADPAAVPQLYVPVVADADGVARVDVAPTQIKGMLRSAFEAVTNSRFGIVSRAHENPLHSRSAASSGSGLQPVVVAHTADGPELHVGGVLNVSDPDMESLPGAVLEAWAHLGDAIRRPCGLLTETRPDRALANGQRVEAVVEQRTISVPGPEGTTRTMARWHVVDAAPVGAVPAGGLTVPADRRWARVTGYLHITGPTIKGKRYERLFLDTCEAAHPDVTFEEPALVTAEETADLLANLERLIDDQRAAHRVARKDEVWQRSHDGVDYRPWDYFGQDPGRTAWARHLYDVASASEDVEAPPWVGTDLRPTTAPSDATTSRFTCWAELDGTPRARVKLLRPVMISRLPHDRRPLDLLHKSLRPADVLDDLSPADRVFGWVADATAAEADKGASGAGRSARRAHRGQVRVVRVRGPKAAHAVASMPAPVVLPVLSTPKPSQGRFYLGRLKGGGPAELEHGTTRADFFKQSQVWRGRKIYLYQRRNGGPQPSRTPSGVLYPTDPGTQSSYLHEWIQPEMTFTFDLLIDNLSETELGALLWLLDPDRLGAGKDRAGRMRLGLAKPYGFGVVEVRLAPERTRLATGRQITRRFADLTAEPADDQRWTTLAGAFQDRVGIALGPVIAALRAAAVGVTGPVHYPRQRPEGQDHGYEWFVENERAAERRAKFNRQVSRGRAEKGKPAPKEDRSLPLLNDGANTALDAIVVRDD